MQLELSNLCNVQCGFVAVTWNRFVVPFTIFNLPNQTDFLFGCSVVWLNSLVVGKSHNCWKTYPFQMHSLDLQNPIWYQTHLSDTFLQLKSYQKVFRHISVGTGNLVKYQNMRDFLILFSNRTTKLFLLNQTIQKIFKQPISNQTKLIPGGKGTRTHDNDWWWWLPRWGQVKIQDRSNEQIQQYRVTSVLWDYILLTSFECFAVCPIQVGQL